MSGSGKLPDLKNSRFPDGAGSVLWEQGGQKTVPRQGAQVGKLRDLKNSRFPDGAGSVLWEQGGQKTVPRQRAQVEGSCGT